MKSQQPRKVRYFRHIALLITFSRSIQLSRYVFLDLPIRCKAQVVERFMLVERLEEEKAQLKTEMKSFLMFYLDTILPNLRGKKVSINAQIGIDKMHTVYIVHIFWLIFMQCHQNSVI